MNLNFIAAGAVDPSIFYVLAQGAVALWLAERAGEYPLTRFLMLYVNYKPESKLDPLRADPRWKILMDRLGLQAG